MTTKHYTSRPAVFTVVQWTGDNLAEIEAAFPTVTFTDNGDGTIAFPYLPGSMSTATVGQYLTNSGSAIQAFTADPGENAQEVLSTGPFDYTVTEATA